MRDSFGKVGEENRETGRLSYDSTPWWKCRPEKGWAVDRALAQHQSILDCATMNLGGTKFAD
jgi:hypothetical protein